MLGKRVWAAAGMAVLAVILASCSGTPRAAPARSRAKTQDVRESWEAAHLDLLLTLQRDASTIAADIGVVEQARNMNASTNDSTSQLTGDCASLGTDVSTAQNTSGISNGTWSSVLNELQPLSAECQDAVAYYEQWGVFNNEWWNVSSTAFSAATQLGQLVTVG